MRKAYIVDSSEYWAGILRAHLLRYEIEVVAWHKRATGWHDALASDVPHYIFIEDQIPLGSGLQSMDMMGGMLKRSVKVVFQHSLQGFPANEIEAQAFAHGAHRILRKPYRVQEIKRLALDVAF